MKCDQVFDVLTRGPFPTGADDDVDVERHLRACHECRQLAEALRPAVELLHESIEAGESDQLPGYHGSLVSAFEPQLDAAVMTMIRRENRKTAKLELSVRKKYPSFINAGWFAAVALLGVVFCFAVLAAQRLTHVARHDQRSIGIDSLERFQPDEDGLRQLVALNLPDGCLCGNVERKQSPKVQSSAIYQCCTRCHSATSKHQPPIDSVAMLARSCEMCHE